MRRLTASSSATLLACLLPCAWQDAPLPPPAEPIADSPARAAGSRPNVLVLIADDVGFGDLSITGARDLATPNLDALARSGARFRAGYVTAPVCAPSRAAILTGRSQTRFGFEFNPGQPPIPGAGLPAGIPTLADRMRAAGYATGLVGKWHLGESPGQRPTERGFDEFFGFLGNANHYDPAQPRERCPILRGVEIVEEKEWLTPALGREAAAFIARHAGHPFFLCAAFSAAHTIIEPDPRLAPRVALIADERRRDYANLVVGLDDAVGAIRTALREAGLEERTLVFFLSDNGGARRESNAPLRGGKSTTSEGGIRVPFFLSFPGRVPADLVYEPPVLALDVAATALAAAGVDPAGDPHLEGVDLLPRLAGADPAPPHATLCWRFGSRMAVRRGDWKLVIPIAGMQPQLFDLASDPGERNDLSAGKPDLVKELQAEWDAWNAGNVAPIWTGGEDSDEPPRGRRDRRREDDGGQ
jgi:arylsulfatase A-like enzyme